MKKFIALSIVFGCCLMYGGCTGTRVNTMIPGDAHEVATITRVTREAMQRFHLRALIVQVRSGGKNVYTGAFGESMTGVPARTDMHFRNGAMAFTYMATLLLELVDQKKVRLDDPLSTFLPELPHADRITLKMLANMSSGYADYVYQPEVLGGTNRDPFQQWTSGELIRIGISKPMMFAPGTNWGYSHTNYVILGRVLAHIAGMRLNQALQRYVFDPLGLKQTRGYDTPEIPEPVLHAFSSERREYLGIKSGVPFYEESTYWNPSWTTAPGAVEITDIGDMTTSIEAVGTGRLLSSASFEAQVGPSLVGFGHVDPKCPVCRKNTMAFHYGLGIMLLGPWIAQTKSFAGSSATTGYLPSKKLAVTVVTTYAPGAFDAEGNYQDASAKTFTLLVNALAPKTLPRL